MLSYAQNAEDVVLRRAFLDTPVGSYIDVGAGHPVEDSVTNHFYERGWRGVNVEPDAPLHAELTGARPRDISLCAAVGRDLGEVTYYPTGTRGHGTLSVKLAAERKPGPEPRSVPCIQLQEIFQRYAPDEQVHFVKIDVEGAEEDVLASGDFRRFRPYVVVVEAMDAEGCPTHVTWEPILLGAGYFPALFDGLNRFYCCGEQAELLLPRLTAPANIFDNYRLAREASALAAAAARAETEAARASSLEQSLASSEQEYHAAQEACEQCQEELHLEQEARQLLEQERRAAHEARERLDADRDMLLATIRELERLHAQERAARDLAARRGDLLEVSLTALRHERDTCISRVQEVEDVLAAERLSRQELNGCLRGLKSSPSWRLTKPVRAMSTIAQLLRRGG